MLSANLLSKYEPPKNQGPSTIRRYPLEKRPAPPPPPVAEPPAPAAMAEKPVAKWSEWQFIKHPSWEGYWRACAQADGGWHYHFTKDGTTVWEQKLPKLQVVPMSAAAAATPPAPASVPFTAVRRTVTVARTATGERSQCDSQCDSLCDSESSSGSSSSSSGSSMSSARRRFLDLSCHFSGGLDFRVGGRRDRERRFRSRWH